MPDITFNSFNGGEVSPLFYGRSDQATYYSSCKELINFIPVQVGALISRGGTQFVEEVKDSTKATALLEFIFNDEQAYAIEVGDGYMRFYKDRGVITESGTTITGATAANPVVITATAHGYANGDQVVITGVAGMTQLNGKRFTVANQTANTYELSGVNGSAYTAYTSGGFGFRVYTIVSPYAAADLFDGDGVLILQVAQSADVLYLAHPDYMPQTLTRTGDTAWVLADFEAEEGPYKDENLDQDQVMYWSGATAAGSSGTLKANFSAFTADHVGAKFMLRIADAAQTPPWETAKAKSLNDEVVAGLSHYVCTDAGTTGAEEPNHTIGEAWDGTDVSAACRWLYQHNGTVTFEITAFTDAQTVTATAVTIVPSQLSSSKTITGITTANPAVVTATSHGFANGDKVLIDGVAGMTEVNDRIFAVAGVTANTFQLVGEDSTLHATYTSGGVAIPHYTDLWREGAWSDNQGYPRSVEMHENRLCWAGTAGSPLSIDFSRSNDFTYYNPLDENGGISRATAFRRSLDSNNPIRWLKSTERGLVVGTVGGEWLITTEAFSQALGPDTALARRFSEHGSSSIKPVQSSDAVLYTQRTRKRVREIVFNFDRNTLVAQDLLVRAEHLTEAGICCIAFQEEPYHLLWGALTDGTLVSLTYNKEEGVNVVAWARHHIGGTGVSIKSMVSLPSPTEDRDDLWMIIERTINGATKKYVEFLHRPHTFGDTQADGKYSDSNLTYDGVATSAITGLDHLEGEVVSIMADGGAHDNKTVSGGAITLDNDAEKVHVGLYSTRSMETLAIEGQPQDGGTRGRAKRVIELHLGLVDTLGGHFGTSAAYMDRLLYDEHTEMDAAPTLFDGDLSVTVNDDNQDEKHIRIEQRQPLPMAIRSMTARFELAND